jgi:hypothetical protein
MFSRSFIRWLRICQTHKILEGTEFVRVSNEPDGPNSCGLAWTRRSTAIRTKSRIGSRRVSSRYAALNQRMHLADCARLRQRRMHSTWVRNRVMETRVKGHGYAGGQNASGLGNNDCTTDTSIRPTKMFVCTTQARTFRKHDS